MPKANPKDLARARYYRRSKNYRPNARKAEGIGQWLTGIITIGAFAALIIIIVSVANVHLPTGSQIVTRDGDIVDIQYSLYYDNGTGVKNNVGQTLTNETIGGSDLLPAFERNLVGLRCGVPSSFVIPASQGYTDPSSFLYGQNLHFTVTITSLWRNGKELY